jgi:hypothetical protein
VIYLNGKQDMVKGFLLDALITQQQIVKFKRQDGWIEITSENIRKAQTGSYFGQERREAPAEARQVC